MRELVLALALFAAGCWHLVPHDQLPPRLEYPSFSVDRPADAHWSLDLAAGESRLVLRRALPGNEGHELATGLTAGLIDLAHSYFVYVGVGSLAGEPGSAEEFAELANWRFQMTGVSDPRDRYQQWLTEKQGQWCIRVELTKYDLGLIYVLRGYRCLHPAQPRITLDFYWSERALPHELDPRLYPEGEAILDSVTIDER